MNSIEDSIPTMTYRKYLKFIGKTEEEVKESLKDDKEHQDLINAGKDSKPKRLKYTESL